MREKQLTNIDKAIDYYKYIYKALDDRRKDIQATAYWKINKMSKEIIFDRIKEIVLSLYNGSKCTAYPTQVICDWIKGSYENKYSEELNDEIVNEFMNKYKGSNKLIIDFQLNQIKNMKNNINDVDGIFKEASEWEKNQGWILFEMIKGFISLY